VITHTPAWLDSSAADALLAACRLLDWHQRSVVIFGKKIAQPRLVAYIAPTGEGYSYSGLRLTPEASPDWASSLLERVSAAAGETFNSILLNRYRDGKDGIGWHSDDEKELGADPIVASLSLGSARTFLTRLRAGCASTGTALGHGDLCVMPRGFQASHVHSISKTAKPVGERVSLTFRKICL